MDIVFNVAKGRVAHYGTLPAANDSIIAVPLESAGLEADEVLKDYDSLSQLLAGATNEQATMGRQTAVNVVVSIDDTNDLARVDCDDVTWSGASGNAVGAVLFCYKPDVASADTAIIPLTKHDFVVTPDGSNVTSVVAAGGFFQAS